DLLHDGPDLLARLGDDAKHLGNAQARTFESLLDQNPGTLFPKTGIIDILQVSHHRRGIVVARYLGMQVSRSLLQFEDVLHGVASALRAGRGDRSPATVL